MMGQLVKVLGTLAAMAALLWAATQVNLEWDLSASGQHSLSPTSIQVVSRIDQPLRLTAYVADDPELRRAVVDFVDRYRRELPTLELRFVDPLQESEETRTLGIPASGALLVEYNDGSELLRQLNETQLTGCLQRLLMRGERWVVSISGHGERRFDGDANHDLRDFAKTLKREGYRLHNVDLTASEIPDNTGVLVISDPRAPFRSEEKLMVADYLARGGNLLWLNDTGRENLMSWMWDQIPVSPLAGTIVDAEGARLGLEDPRIVAVGTYADHPLSRHLDVLTLFPKAVALAPRAASDDWTATELLSSSSASWNETGDVKGQINRNAEAGESPGPLALAVAMERDDQRVVVVGDGDFLSNAYLGNGGNLDLGLAMVRWLTENDALIDIPAPIAADARIELPRNSVAVIAGIFLVGIPATLVLAGLWINLRRRRR